MGVDMFAWEKMGKLFDPQEHQGKTWMHEFAQSPSAVVFEDRVRVFFCTRPKPDVPGMYTSHMAYIDLDRHNLLQIVGMSPTPLLPLGKRGTFDEFGTNPISVIRDGDALRAYYAGWTRCESVPINGAIGVAISHDDGETFQRLGEGPVISYSPDEPFMMGSPRIRRFNGVWQLWYVSGKVWLRENIHAKPEPVYKVRMATSTDGLNWKKLGRDLLPDKLGVHECQACPDVFFHQNQYHMFYCYRESHNYKTQQGGYRIGYAHSEDMLTWMREDERAGIGPSVQGWDAQMANYPHVFALDDEVYMLYQGNEMGRTGMGLARLISA